LDLLIKGNQANSSELYIIEVKLTDPESADTEKQRIYYQWLEKQPGVQRREAVLVALEGKKGYYEGFRLFPWSNLCVELRKIIRTALLRQKPIVAALALAFVGAVEENLLRFSGRLVQHVYTGEVPPLVTTEISDHLGKFLLEVDNDSRK
jgi:hypothetical protein